MLPGTMVTAGDSGVANGIIGRDVNRDYQATNVRTVVVRMKERVAVTSHPGLPANVNKDDKRIVGTPQWFKVDWTLF